MKVQEKVDMAMQDLTPPFLLTLGPHIRHRVAQAGQGVVGEDCLSTQYEFRSRLTS